MLVRTYVHTYSQPMYSRVGKPVPHVGYPMQAMQVSACMRGRGKRELQGIGGACMGGEVTTLTPWWAAR